MSRNHPAPPPPPGAWLRPELVASWREIILVILVMIGPYIWRSSFSAWHGSALHFLSSLLSNATLMRSLVSEGVMLSFFLWLLHRRGWNVSDFRIRLGVLSSLQGVALLFAGLLMAIIVRMSLLIILYRMQKTPDSFLHFLVANGPHLKPHSIVLSWSVLFAAMILNAYMEEMVCTGYVFTQLAEKWGTSLGLTATLILRMACHTYQGPVNALAIGGLFLVFGLWYWKGRNLWPLILAHTLLDIMSGTVIKLLHGQV